MNDEMEVYFNEYCKKCEYEKLEGYKDPCDICLDHPYNIDSHKPVEFKEKEITK